MTKQQIDKKKKTEYSSHKSTNLIPEIETLLLTHNRLVMSRKRLLFWFLQNINPTCWKTTFNCDGKASATHFAIALTNTVTGRNDKTNRETL